MKKFKSTSDLADYHRESSFDKKFFTPQAHLEQLHKTSAEQSTTLNRSKPMSFITVKSNFARNRTITIGPRNECTMTFDHEGLAKVPAHQRPLVDQLMKVRQGRFKIVEEPKEEKQAAPELTSLVEKLKEEKKAEAKKAEPKAEAKPEKQEDEPKPKAEAKSKPKKKSSKKSETKSSTKSSTTKKENE